MSARIETETSYQAVCESCGYFGDLHMDDEVAESDAAHHDHIHHGGAA